MPTTRNTISTIKIQSTQRVQAKQTNVIKQRNELLQTEVRHFIFECSEKNVI